MLKFLLLLLLALSSTSCQREPSHKEINFAIAQMPQNLDPRYATDAASERVNRLLYQSLFDLDATIKPIPILAMKSEMSGLEYRITLKMPRSVFHNQVPLNAVDVVATYQSILQLKDSPHTSEFSNIESVHALGNNLVVFKLKKPDAHFVAKLIIGILPKKLIVQSHDFSHNPVGSGPLKFVSWRSKLTLQRLNDGQLICLQEVRDPTVRVLKLLRGETDLLQGDLSPELVKFLQSQHEVKVGTSVGANFSYLGLNLHDPILRQLSVRQAIAHAIDTQAIIEKVMVQNSRVASAILPPEHYAGNAHLIPYGYNPELSKKRLYEAGIKLPLKLVYKTSTDAQRIRFATILQAQMRPAGIDLEIRSLDWGTFFEDVNQGKFQLFGLTWVGIKTPEIYSKAFGSKYFPPNGFNRGRYADEELDAMLAKEDWPAVTARIYAQLPYVPLWYEGQFAAMRINIQNYSPKPDGNWDDLMTIKRSVQ
jgi:peptide/nickel transport system substrate-binding protein